MSVVPSLRRTALTAHSARLTSSGARRPVVGRRVPQPPDLCGAEFVDGLSDQIRSLEFVGGAEIRFYVGHDVGVAVAPRDLAANALPILQRRVAVGEVIAGPHS